MVCTFFGHHDCPASVKQTLFEEIKKQITQGASCFYIGNNGNFDTMALSCLKTLKKEYKDIRYAVVIAYISANKNEYLSEETVFPEGIETVPKRFAIDFRNRWMIDHSDTVISYIAHSFGGAAKYVKKAKNKGAVIINLFEDN